MTEPEQHKIAREFRPDLRFEELLAEPRLQEYLLAESLAELRDYESRRTIANEIRRQLALARA